MTEGKITVTPETVKAVKEIATQFDKPFDEVKVVFGDIIKSPILKNLENKEEMALKMLKARLGSEFDRPTQNYEIYVIDTSKPIRIKKRDGNEMTIANVYGLGVNPAEAKKQIRFCKVAHFDNNVGKVKGVEPGKFYKVKLTGGIDGKHYKLAAADITTWTPDESEVPEGFKDPTALIRREFEKVDIAEAILKVGQTDLFLIEGQVTGVRPSIAKKNGEGSFAIYKVADNSILDDKQMLEEMRGGMTIFVDPDQVKCGFLSTVLVLGRFNKNEEYGTVGMNGELVIPIIPMPLSEDPEGEVEPEDTGLTTENAEVDIFNDSEL